VELAERFTPRGVIAIISCQTSTVQDFTVQKFILAARSGHLPSPTLGTETFMTKEEGGSIHRIYGLLPVFDAGDTVSGSRSVTVAL
jgi:hypothetical protein